jgi:nitrate/TMAO reductase-like tetraheme cytochrome c subunit
MKRFLQSIKQFFLPSEESSIWLRIAPYLVLGFFTLAILGGGAYAWEFTNSPEFCGQSCHTMPPEYTSYLVSPHARVECVDCHIGEGFITTRITRKAGDIKHVTATLFQTYEYPIKVKSMRPARETCELCHFPEKFSDDSLRTYVNFRSDEENSSYTTYLVLKTGGGSEREGLGQGIHWHIENPVYYLPLDRDEQQIPYIQVINDDGSSTEYFDISSDFNPEDINPEDLKEMDCITCHNRITHLVSYPEEMVDTLLERELISPDIPNIRKVALETFYADHGNNQTAEAAFDLLNYYYQQQYPDYYAANQEEISQAISELKSAYTSSVYPEQKSDWSSHPNNIGHQNTPGCFRCHSGQHLTEEDEAIRLECNLCHAIPVISDSGEFLTQIEISTGPEPENHLNTNWISLHHLVYDPSCGTCHTMADPGGSSNTSFCSNAACHGFSYEFAGFDAPALREEILATLPTPQPSPTPAAMPEDPEELTYTSLVRGILENRCGVCHGETAQAGLNLLTYQTALAGTENGPVILPGDPDGSQLLLKTADPGSHFAQFTRQEVELLRAWIDAGAVE